MRLSSVIVVNSCFTDMFEIRLKFLHFYTLMGFLLGFLTAFATLVIYANFAPIIEHNHVIKQRQTGNLAVSLQRDIRVLCLVLTCPKYHESKAAHVLATWGQRCTKIVFTSSENDTELGAVAVVDPLADDYHGLWNKTRESFRYVYEEYFEEFDWFLKADDDTYIIMENLRYLLAAYDATIPIYFGHKMIRYEKEYLSGGASYVLSKEALHRFMSQAYNNKYLCPPAHRFAAEDLYMGMCLHKVGVIVADGRHALPTDDKPKFFPLELSAFMEPEWNSTLSEWLFEMTPYHITTGMECCSEFSISFHYVTAQQMYAYEFMIYKLNIFGLPRTSIELPKKIDYQQARQIYSQS